MMVAWLDVLREVYPESPEQLAVEASIPVSPAPFQRWHLCGRCGHKCSDTAIFCIGCGAELWGAERMAVEIAAMRRRRFEKRPGRAR